MLRDLLEAKIKQIHENTHRVRTHTGLRVLCFLKLSSREAAWSRDSRSFFLATPSSLSVSNKLLAWSWSFLLRESPDFMLEDEQIAAGIWSPSSIDRALWIFLPSIDSSPLAAFYNVHVSNFIFSHSVTKKWENDQSRSCCFCGM